MDEAYSSGTVQDFHLIPFSSVPSRAEFAEQNDAKVEKEFGKANTVLLRIPYERNTVAPRYFNGDEVDANRDLRCEIDKPRYIFGTVKAGQRFGTIKVFVKDVLIEEVPLVAFSDVEKNSGIIARLFDRIIVKTIK